MPKRVYNTSGPLSVCLPPSFALEVLGCVKFGERFFSSRSEPRKGEFEEAAKRAREKKRKKRVETKRVREDEERQGKKKKVLSSLPMSRSRLVE